MSTTLLPHVPPLATTGVGSLPFVDPVDAARCLAAEIAVSGIRSRSSASARGRPLETRR
jgi:hypothetical protein